MKKRFLNCACGIVVPGAALLLLSSLGCGGDNDLASVHGRLTFNGKAIQGIEIVFTPLDQKSRPSVGTCDASGNYTLRFTLKEKGATIGKNRVSIAQPFNEAGQPDYSILRVPPEYGDESELEWTVKAGRNTNVDFDLKIPE